jgi:hypothetical protein
MYEFFSRASEESFCRAVAAHPRQQGTDSGSSEMKRLLGRRFAACTRPPRVVSKMAARLHMTIADKVLAISLVILSAVLFLLIPRWVLSHATEVEILAGDKLAGRYSLNQEQVIDVIGPLGVTKVEIKNGRVRIKSSPCPHGTCMHMGDFGSEGGLLACVPNQVVVKVGKERSDGLDAVTK